MADVSLLKPVHPFSSNTYLLSSDGEYAIIDPSVPFSSGLIDGKLKYILLTHAHFDHMLDIDSWANSTGAPVMISKYDRAALSDPLRNCYMAFLGRADGYRGEAQALSDGDTLPLGNEYISVISTPGHTPGSVIYKIGNSAFVGDLVFAGGGVGRSDLPGGDYSALCASVKLLSDLNGDMILYPGHGDTFTISEFKKYYRFY